MGKLHTLRRAIERDPDAWRGYRQGAWQYRDAGWTPIFWGNSYRSFVRSVLEDIDSRDVGNADDGPDAKAGSA